MKRDKGTPQLRISDQLDVFLIQIYPHSVASDDVTSLEIQREVPATDKSSCLLMCKMSFLHAMESWSLSDSALTGRSCAITASTVTKDRKDVYLGESPNIFSVMGNCRVSCDMSMSVYVHENLFCPYGMGLGPVRQLTTT